MPTPFTKLGCALACLVACGTKPPRDVAMTTTTTTTEAIALPGAGGPVTVDFIAYERGRDRVWIPVGETGSVDVFDIASRTFARADGFKTREREAHGRKRMMGPSSVTFGEGVAFVGDRASNEVCAVDTTSLKVGACVTLESAPDAVAYVAATHEVWATTPKEPSITILDATGPLRVKSKIKTAGEPEADAIAGDVFLTNFEDKNVTVAIDVASHDVKSTWPLQCSDGPRGLAYDDAHRIAFVACTNGLESVDTRDGRVVAKLDVGEGVDLLDFAGGKVYVAAGRSEVLTIARADERGALTTVETIATRPGARNAVV
ncbi:MAG TPA: hypothetical protein VGH87_29605, partial [Polyangiaceae bacterium]